MGTPEFASPEQFAGVQVDIRSDLYSLGVTLWVMMTGQTPFRGTSAEVMYQHQHAPLPLEQLKDVPQPVVVLLEKLLEKDPAQRFQTPDELLRALPTITGAIGARRGITRRNLQQIPPPTSRVGTRNGGGIVVVECLVKLLTKSIKLLQYFWIDRFLFLGNGRQNKAQCQPCKAK